MFRKLEWKNSLWKIIGVLSVISVIFTLIASILQIYEYIDFWAPISSFFTYSLPVYVVLLVIFLVACISYYSTVKLKGYQTNKKDETNVLDLSYGKKLAQLCKKPRTTEFLKKRYDRWEKQSDFVVLGGMNFDDYMKRLEDKNYLVYEDGKWRVTQEALKYLRKYQG